MAGDSEPVILNRKPLSLVILLQDLEFGGTQRYAINLLRHLDRQLFAPELWVLRGGDDMASMASETGVRIVRLSAALWITPWALIRLIKRLVLHRPQILYTLTVVPNIWGRIFGKMARVPAIVSGYRNLFPKQHERRLWPLSDRIICNARILKEFMSRQLSVDPRRIVVIPNGVDTGFFHPIPEQRAPEPTVLFVGRLVKEKAPVNLLKGFRMVLQEMPEARLVMVGAGRLSNQLEAAIRSHSLDSRVRLIPYARDVRSHLNRAWVLALASAQEASPNVIIEAMAAGLPVVATRVGGIPELVVDGRTGILTDPDDPKGLSEALIGLLSGEGKRRRMGRNARERVLKYHSVETMVRETEKVFIETIP